MDSVRTYLMRTIDRYQDDVMALIMDDSGCYQSDVAVNMIFRMEIREYRNMELFVARHLRSLYRVKCISKESAKALRLEMLDYLSDCRSGLYIHLARYAVHHALGSILFQYTVGLAL